MTTVSEISKLIRSKSWTADELRQLRAAYMAAVNISSIHKRAELVEGSSVKFTGRAGNEMRGVVKKVNRKTAQVQVGPTKWNVSIHMLSAA